MSGSAGRVPVLRSAEAAGPAGLGVARGRQHCVAINDETGAGLGGVLGIVIATGCRHHGHGVSYESKRCRRLKDRQPALSARALGWLDGQGCSVIATQWGWPGGLTSVSDSPSPSHTPLLLIFPAELTGSPSCSPSPQPCFLSHCRARLPAPPPCAVPDLTLSPAVLSGPRRAQSAFDPAGPGLVTLSSHHFLVGADGMRLIRPLS